MIDVDLLNEIVEKAIQKECEILNEQTKKNIIKQIVTNIYINKLWRKK